MDIKAIGFDIGGTLVNYNKPLNWSESYEPALKYMCSKTDIEYNSERIESAKAILTKYNTRINPRELEVSSDIIFDEIFTTWKEVFFKVERAKKSFYEYFQREVTPYEDAIELLEYCQKHGIKCAVYTDIAYGMDDEFALKDIEEISDFFELCLTSGNVGYRKPNKTGFEKMLKEFNCKPEQMLFVGDEAKDITGADSVNMHTVLIDRNFEDKNFGQEFTVNKLNEIINIIKTK